MTVRTVVGTITVASGTGTAVFSFPSFSGFKLKVVSIDAPGASTHTWVIRDAQGYALAGAAAASADQTYYYDVPSLGPLSMTFTSSTDGTYSVKMGVEFGS